jgi:hypothetical protein
LEAFGADNKNKQPSRTTNRVIKFINLNKQAANFMSRKDISTIYHTNDSGDFMIFARPNDGRIMTGLPISIIILRPLLILIRIGDIKYNFSIDRGTVVVMS